MKSTLLFLILVLSISITNKATADDKPLQGKAKLDSLEAELPYAKGDTNEVNLLINLSDGYAFLDADKGIKFGNQSVELANKINWEKGLAKCYYTIATCYYSNNNLKKAMNYLLKSLEVSRKTGNKREIAQSLGNIGILYEIQTDNTKALEYYSKAVRMNKEIGNNVNLAMNLSNIGVVYENQSNYPKALDYFFKALKLNEKTNTSISMVANLSNIGLIYKKLGNSTKALKYSLKALEIAEKNEYKRKTASILLNVAVLYKISSDYKKAMSYNLRALKLNKELKAYHNLALNYSNIGNLKKFESNYSEALNYYKKALILYEEYGSIKDVASIYLSFASLYIDLNAPETNAKFWDELRVVEGLNKEISLERAINYLTQSKSIYIEIKDQFRLSKTYNLLHKANNLKGNYHKSLEYYKQYKQLQDSIFSQNNADKIAALEKAREDDLKQKEIEKQKLKIAEQEKREKLILYFSIGFIIVMAVVMFIIYRLLKRSDKLLYNVLPVSIAKRLKNKEHPISDYFTQASIVFIDIVNFTEMAKNEDPRKLVEALNAIFTSYDTIAKKYGLEKIKTIGDSYMAAAGIPEVQKDNTHRAAQMALEVKEMMSDYRTANGVKIEVRIGLDCGPVVAGVIGENKFIYDMWSDAVNTASRMESTSESGQVHITECFKEAVSEYDEFDYVERGEIEIKGKGKMKTYYIADKEMEIV